MVWGIIGTIQEIEESEKNMRSDILYTEVNSQDLFEKVKFQHLPDQTCWHNVQHVATWLASAQTQTGTFLVLALDFDLSRSWTSSANPSWRASWQI